MKLAQCRTNKGFLLLLLDMKQDGSGYMQPRTPQNVSPGLTFLDTFSAFNLGVIASYKVGTRIWH